MSNVDTMAVTKENPLVFVLFDKAWPTRTHSKEELEAYKKNRIDPQKERKVAWVESYLGPLLNETGTKRTTKRLEVGDIGVTTKLALAGMQTDHKGCFKEVDAKAYEAQLARKAKAKAEGD